MSSSINVTLLGDASPRTIAVWVCGFALVILFGAIITKTTNRKDLRFLTCCVLVGVFVILGFAHFSPDRLPPAETKMDETPGQQPASSGAIPLPSTNDASESGEYPTIQATRLTPHHVQR